MPPKRRGRKRKARPSDEGECESRLLQPDPGNRSSPSRRSLRSNVIDFEEIIRGSGILPASDDSANSSNAVSQQNINEGCGGVIQQTTSQLSETDRAQVVANPPRAPRHAIAQYNLNPHSSSLIPSVLPECVQLADDDIAAHVPPALKQQIARGEYVNLALLLKGSIELSDIYDKGSTLRLSADGKIETQARPCKDKIYTIEKWTDAFIVYASIYTASNLNKIYEIFHYMWVIRECAARQGDLAWREYDEQFRLRQALKPSSWARINNDLWWRCVQTRPNSPFPVDNTRAPRAPSCNQFNEGRCNWPMCKFPHICSKCSAFHAAVNCPSNMQRQEFSGNYTNNFRGRNFRFSKFRGRNVSRGNTRGSFKK